MTDKKPWWNRFQKGMTFRWKTTEMLTILFFRIYDPIPILLSKVDLRSNPILSPSWEKDLRSDTFRSFSILSDPYHVYLRIQFHKSCVFWNLTTFLTIARSHKIMILLRNANFSLKNAICLWKITGWENLFFIFKKIWLSFVQKDLEKKSDHFRSDPWFLDLRIRSRSSRRKWIYDPITILKNGDLDPKGSRSDHDRQISVPTFVSWNSNCSIKLMKMLASW